MTGDILRNAIRYWEIRRLWYDFALAALAAAWVLLTWPHFRPTFTLDSLLKLLVLATLANLCYSAAYLVDIPLQQSSSFGVVWRHWRWVLWLFGTLFALAVACYWIADEIYPYVGAA